MANADALPVIQIELQRVRAQSSKLLEPLLTPDARAGLEVTLEREVRGMVLAMRRHILTIGEETQSQGVSYPRDWWEAVKQRFAPHWFLRRWPIRFRTHRLEVKSYGAVCPHHDITRPDLHLEFLRDARDWPAPAGDYGVDDRGWGTR